MPATETLGLEIDWWDDTVGVFEPEKVLRQVARAFPQVEIDPTDHQDARLQRELDLWSGTVLEEGSREILIRQAKRMNRTNGPTFRFAIPFSSGHRVEGLVRRLSLTFTLCAELPAEVRGQLRGFLSGLAMGVPTWARDDEGA